MEVGKKLVVRQLARHLRVLVQWLELQYLQQSQRPLMAELPAKKIMPRI